MCNEDSVRALQKGSNEDWEDTSGGSQRALAIPLGDAKAETRFFIEFDKKK